MTTVRRDLCWAAAGLALLAAAPRARAQAKDLSIAVVNIGEVFERYYKKNDLDTTLRAQRAKNLEVIKAKREELQKLQEEAQLFDMGTDARKRADERLLQKRVELEVYGKIAQDEFVRAQRQYTVDLYDEIRGLLSKYAKANRIDLVLKIEDREIAGDTLQMIQLEIKIRLVLYAESAVDITEKFIASINAGHKPPAAK